ncbi:hypothetical protein DL93DRAFT_2098036 [Clavulina sp. PMI_390]|nr:hypothetical protein DL93DRAFT_2098036 [Clavulina sp. PMI_390]
MDEPEWEAESVEDEAAPLPSGSKESPISPTSYKKMKRRIKDKRPPRIKRYFCRACTKGFDRPCSLEQGPLADAPLYETSPSFRAVTGEPGPSLVRRPSTKPNHATSALPNSKLSQLRLADEDDRYDSEEDEGNEYRVKNEDEDDGRMGGSSYSSDGEPYGTLRRVGASRSPTRAAKRASSSEDNAAGEYDELETAGYRSPSPPRRNQNHLSSRVRPPMIQGPLNQSTSYGRSTYADPNAYANQGPSASSSGGAGPSRVNPYSYPLSYNPRTPPVLPPISSQIAMPYRVSPYPPTWSNHSGSFLESSERTAPNPAPAPHREDLSPTTPTASISQRPYTLSQMRAQAPPTPPSHAPTLHSPPTRTRAGAPPASEQPATAPSHRSFTEPTPSFPPELKLEAILIPAAISRPGESRLAALLSPSKDGPDLDGRSGGGGGAGGASMMLKGAMPFGAPATTAVSPSLAAAGTAPAHTGSVHGQSSVSPLASSQPIPNTERSASTSPSHSSGGGGVAAVSKSRSGGETLSTPSDAAVPSPTSAMRRVVSASSTAEAAASRTEQVLRTGSSSPHTTQIASHHATTTRAGPPHYPGQSSTAMSSSASVPSASISPSRATFTRPTSIQSLLCDPEPNEGPRRTINSGSTSLPYRQGRIAEARCLFQSIPLMLDMRMILLGAECL